MKVVAPPTHENGIAESISLGGSRGMRGAGAERENSRAQRAGARGRRSEKTTAPLCDARIMYSEHCL